MGGWKVFSWILSLQNGDKKIQVPDLVWGKSLIIFADVIREWSPPSLPFLLWRDIMKQMSAWRPDRPQRSREAPKKKKTPVYNQRDRVGPDPHFVCEKESEKHNNPVRPSQMLG